MKHSLGRIFFTGAALFTMAMLANGAPPDATFIADMKSARLAQNPALASGDASEIERIRKIYAELIAKYPHSADPHAALGEFLYGIGKSAEARQEWDAALKIEPDRADLYAAQSSLALRAGDTIEAARLMELAVKKAPEDPSYHFALAHLYFLFRQELFPARKTTEAAFFALALDHFRLAAELAPLDANYARTYAETFYTVPDADWNIALAAWQKVLPLTKEPSFVHAQLVRVSLHLKDKPAAQRYLALITDPKFANLKTILQRQIDRM